MGRLFIESIDMGAIIRDSMKSTGMATKEHRGLVPDLSPARAPLSKVTGIVKKAMTIQKISYFSPAVFHAVGALSTDVAALEGLYSARHVLATAGDVMEIPDKHWLSVGGWSGQAAKANLAMPNLYSQAKLWRDAVVKHSIMMAINTALEKYASTHGGSLPEHWEPLFDLLPRRQYTLAERSDLMEIAGVTERAHNTVWQESHISDMKISEMDEPSDFPSNGDDGSDSVDSEVSSSSEASEAAVDPSLSELVWQLSKGARGRLHLIRDCELACGRQPLHRPEGGSGISEALASGSTWSPRCYRALTQPVRMWWKEAGGIEPD